jgi:hypothetical protein
MVILQVFIATSMKMTVFLLHCVVWYKVTNISGVLTASVIRVMTPKYPPDTKFGGPQGWSGCGGEETNPCP